MDKKAFTLIELSIVLIIIGLIIGGILAGNELVNQSRVRGLINNINNIQTAVNTFKIKYGFLPGDFPYAGANWPSSTCTDAAVPTGCNGNGDGIITDSGTSGEEDYRFWQHLSLAGMLGGTYTGTNAITDMFLSSYSNSTYIDARNTKPFVGATLYNVLEIGAYHTGFRLAVNGDIKPVDAFNMDTKIDDGKANSGQLYGLDGTNVTPAGSCSYAFAGPSVAAYNIAGTQGPYCKMMSRMN